ncbi:hypothetical protein M5K25_025656 [Dendrobium thyrsiflorum]|uniref:Uncharacterized protein n=1 Tax=Dendrobium thyrsiflorum TaxID=117978 RepID=A0ABD0U4N2_DENTH
MDQEHIQRTLDVILGQLGSVAQQIRDTQGELTDFRIRICCSRTLDVILGQLGSVAQQIRDTQGELTDFRRQTGERLDNIERFGNPAIYTPSRPHSPYGEDARNEFGPPREPYRNNLRPNQEPLGHDTPCGMRGEPSGADVLETKLLDSRIAESRLPSVCSNRLWAREQLDEPFAVG